MTVERMIKELQKCDPNAEVKMHHHAGNNALFVVSFVNIRGVVVIEDKSDNDLRAELLARWERASENNFDTDELDFFMDLIETGFTLNDIKENIPEHYKYAEKFMREHGLI